MQGEIRYVEVLQRKAADAWWPVRYALYLIIYLGIMFLMWTQYRKSKKLENLENEKDLKEILVREQAEEVQRAEMVEKRTVLYDRLIVLEKEHEELKQKTKEVQDEYRESSKDIDRIRNWDSFWEVVDR